jgi:hypothetical protein
MRIVTGAKLAELHKDFSMQTTNVVQRAFELAPGSADLEEIRKALKDEGYSNVDAHLAGPSLRADLKKRLAN